MNFPRIKSIKLGQKNKRWLSLPRKMAEKSFLTFLVLFLIILFFSVFIFYYYIFPADVPDNHYRESLFQLDREAQWRVLEEWQRRNEVFYQADFKEYPNPFK